MTDLAELIAITVASGVVAYGAAYWAQRGIDALRRRRRDRWSP